MHTSCPALGSTNVQATGGEVDIVPVQSHKLAGPQAMPVGNQDGGGVPVAPAVAPRGIHQLLNLPLGEILPRTGTLLTVTFSAVEASSKEARFSTISLHL